VDNAPGAPTSCKDPGTRGLVTGVGIESQSIISMTDTMMRDIMSILHHNCASWPLLPAFKGIAQRLGWSGAN